MFVYFDTSALLKFVVDEPGRDVVLALWQEAERLASARITAPETQAALAAARRGGRLDADSHARARRDARRRLASAITIDLTESLADQAGGLAEDHGLRGYDAVHLASALALQDPRYPGNPVIFATWDRKLHQAAYDAGLIPAPAVI